ncbi:MAG: family 20 glycosylhydrolase, partial [Chitinophagaceae bacterium]|nr:family 20 glycosylhydrolase [Chitinophagaceae bacterium]
KEVVKYAAERYITVIPEIEMPGHASAAIAAYPELSCFPEEPTTKYFPKNCKWHGDSTGKQVQQTWGIFDDVFCAGQEKTFSFLEDVMDEVLALFPSKYIHVGGDECPKDNWKRCPGCQKRMKDNNLKDEHQLQSYFIQRMEKYLNTKGRTLIGWDEILEGGLAPNAVVMSWRGEAGGIEAAKQNHDVIMTPGNPVYFDHTQSQNEDSVTIGGYNPIEKVYAYEPVPKELNATQAKYILGAQANLWTEYIKNIRKVEYMLFPRISALSEVLWSPKESRNWDDFQKRLSGQFKRYDQWRVNYSKAYFDLKATILPADNFNAVHWKLESKQPGTEIKYITHYAGRPYEMKFTEGTPYTSPVEIRSTMLIAAIGVINNKPVSNPVYETFHFNKATGKKITLSKEASDKYPGDGAFTLVNGVINEKGFARSREFIGFNGTDCEAMIDLGESQTISSVTVNSLNRTASWIWRPLTAEAFGSVDGKTWTSLRLTDDFDESKDATGKGKMKMEFTAMNVRYIKVVISNWGMIPAGNPGAGNKPWLFVDEIEVE